MTKKQFQSKNRSEEIDVLLTDDDTYTKTKTYLEGLILDVLEHFEMPETSRKQLYDELKNDVSVAAERFLAEQRHLTGDYNFSVYFTWYIAQRLKARKDTLLKGVNAKD